LTFNRGRNGVHIVGKPLVPFNGVIAFVSFELLQEPDHTYRPQLALKRIDAMLSDFLEAHFSDVHSVGTSRIQSAGLTTRIRKWAAFFAAARNIPSSVVNNTLHPALSAHAMCRASTALNANARSSFARTKSAASGTIEIVANWTRARTLRRRSEIWNVPQLKLENATADPFRLALLQPIQDEQHGLGFQTNTFLRLVIKGTVQAAGVEVNPVHYGRYSINGQDMLQDVPLYSE